MAKQTKKTGTVDFKEIARKMYDATKLELAELEEKRKILLVQIKNCQQILGLPTSNNKRSSKSSAELSLLSAEAKKSRRTKAKAGEKEKKSATTQKKDRGVKIKSTDLKADIVTLLKQRDSSLSNAEILAELQKMKPVQYKTSNSLRARLSVVFKSLIEEGTMVKVDRGLYRLTA